MPRQIRSKIIKAFYDLLPIRYSVYFHDETFKALNYQSIRHPGTSNTTGSDILEEKNVA